MPTQVFLRCDAGLPAAVKRVVAIDIDGMSIAGLRTQAAKIFSLPSCAVILSGASSRGRPLGRPDGTTSITELWRLEQEPIRARHGDTIAVTMMSSCPRVLMFAQAGHLDGLKEVLTPRRSDDDDDDDAGRPPPPVLPRSEPVRSAFESANLTDAYGRTPLMLAAGEGHTEACYELLRHGANPNSPDWVTGNTALHYAVMAGAVDVCKVLIKFKANAMAHNSRNMSPFQLVVSGIDESLERGESPIPAQVRQQLVLAFIKNGASVSCQRWDGDCEAKDEPMQQESKSGGGCGGGGGGGGGDEPLCPLHRGMLALLVQEVHAPSADDVEAGVKEGFSECFVAFVQNAFGTLESIAIADPERYLSGNLSVLVLPPFRSMLSLRLRLWYVRTHVPLLADDIHQLPGGAVPYHHGLEFEVRRGREFEDAVPAIAEAPIGRLRRPFKAKFDGEAGLDMGGLTRDFACGLAAQACSPALGLFRGYGDCVHLHPATKDVEDHGKLLHAFGRFMAMVLLHKWAVTLPVTVSRVLAKLIVGDSVVPKDYRYLDPVHYDSMQRHLLGNDIGDGEALALNFTVDTERLGSTYVTVPLMKGGDSVTVCESNKQMYVDKLCRFMTVEGCATECMSLVSGFRDVIPAQFASFFTSAEIVMLLCGDSAPTVASLKELTSYKGGYSSVSMHVRWFWEALAELAMENESALPNLVKFATGGSRIPKHDPSWQLIVKRTADTDMLPSASTCFNTLYLPPYPSKAALTTKLRIVVTEGVGFGFE